MVPALKAGGVHALSACPARRFHPAASTHIFPGAEAPGKFFLLPLHADDGFQHGVHGRDDLGVGLEAALGESSSRHVECGGCDHRVYRASESPVDAVLASRAPLSSESPSSVEMESFPNPVERIFLKKKVVMSS